MSINNAYLPKLSAPVYWFLVVAFGLMVLLYFLTGFGEEYLYQGAGVMLVTGFALKKTKFIIKYSSNSDYLEFSTGDFFSLNEMDIKSRLVRLIKNDVKEIDVVGFFLWRKLKVRFVEDGKRYVLIIPLRFVSRKSIDRMIEDIIGERKDRIPVASNEQVIRPRPQLQPVPRLVVH